VKELLKSVNICQSYRKNKSGTFFNGPRCTSLTHTNVLRNYSDKLQKFRCPSDQDYICKVIIGQNRIKHSRAL